MDGRISSAELKYPERHLATAEIAIATVIATVLLFTILIISIASVNPAAGVVAILA